ncbi:MAG TPA: hypothetical protein VH062_06670 [Polyangiaceae bacterium]|nr:hypothetical protein [Polyangiaceae bacterium]
MTGAAKGLANGIPTYVIGVVSPGITCSVDPNPPNQSDLDAVAKAGGTTSALLVDATQSVSQQFLARLTTIRTRSQTPCAYPLPAAQLDPSRINVEYTPSGSNKPSVISRVPAPSDCGPTNGGWYYDNPTAPTEVILCPSTCSAIATSAPTLVSGCATLLAP